VNFGFVSMVMLFVAGTALAQTPAPPPNATAFDGRWAVSLVCEDVTVNGTLVEGYVYTFLADVKEGKLSGQKGQIGYPASLTMVGTIQPDGTAEINAQGMTNNPKTAVGRPQPGTPYSYRMRGTFTKTSGKATRIELRPCEATFFKQ
jgi:hypothetical protein